MALSYLAGVIDGEGSILARLDKRGNWVYVYLWVYNTDYRLMDWLVINFGGYINTVTKHNLNKRTIYRWSPFAKDLEGLLAAVLPYLQLKREQAALGLSWYTADRQSRLHIWACMKSLNKRGEVNNGARTTEARNP